MFKAILKVLFVFLEFGAQTMLPPVAAPWLNGASSIGFEHLKKQLFGTGIESVLHRYLAIVLDVNFLKHITERFHIIVC